MKTYDDVRIRVKSELIEWFAQRVAQRIHADDVKRTNEELHSIIVHGDTIYSFGTHFPMGMIQRNAHGKAIRVILNGDSGGARGYANTAGDQNDLRRHVRSVIDANSLNVDVVIVPFSATDAAGIERKSITPVHVREDRHTYHDIETDVRPGPYAQVETGEEEEYDQETWGYRSPDGTQFIPRELWYGTNVPADAHLWTHDQGTVKRKRPVMREDRTKARVDHRHGHGWAEGYAELQSDGKTWKYTVKRHWLGDAVIRGRSSEVRVRNATKAEREVYETYMRWQSEHSARRQARDDSQSHHVYVKMAHEQGREMRMVSDGPMVVPTAEQVAQAERAKELNARRYAEHIETEPPSNEVVRSGDRYVVRFTVRRWATYLSSFDYNEPHAPYFLCELPWAARNVQSVESALDALKPGEVRMAELAGLNVLRQGDVFAIPTAYTTSELESRAKQHERHAGERVTIRSKVKDGHYADVLGTNHAPTHMIATKDGQFFGRGRLYHTPVGRVPDHRVIDLGDRRTWYRLVKNTVPMAQTGAGRRTMHGGWVGQTVNQSQSRAWMLGGAVD